MYEERCKGSRGEEGSLVAQVLNQNATEQFMATRRREQQKALQKLREDPGLR